MARLTILFGIILILLGGLTFAETGSRFPTSLIPAIFGLILLVCGVLARTTDLKRRGLAMHIAVTVGLLGFLGTAKSVYDYVRLKQGVQFKFPVAVEEKAAMALLLLVFVIASVRNFIAVRKARQAQALPQAQG
jgi:fucose 4-O-acetylase-like acetyltransferase